MQQFLRSIHTARESISLSNPTYFLGNAFAVEWPVWSLPADGDLQRRNHPNGLETFSALRFSPTFLLCQSHFLIGLKLTMIHMEEKKLISSGRKRAFIWMCPAPGQEAPAFVLLHCTHYLRM